MNPTVETTPLTVDVRDLPAMVGTALPAGPWRRLNQEIIDAFAELTDDHQWIHVDADRAATGPFGTTIVHGYLTLALLPTLCRGVLQVTGTRMTLNYGIDRCRFPAPAPAGAAVRATSVIGDVRLRDDGGVVLARDVTVEMADEAKPACVARMLTVLVPDSGLSDLEARKGK